MAVGGAGRRARAHRAAGGVAVGYTSDYGRAKRGAGGSLYLQSAIAGLNSGSRRDSRKTRRARAREDHRDLRNGGTVNPARSGRKQR